MMDKIEAILLSQARRKSMIEEPSIKDIQSMIHDIDYLVSLVGSLTLQINTLEGRLAQLGKPNPYDYYSAVEDLGG